MTWVQHGLQSPRTTRAQVTSPRSQPGPPAPRAPGWSAPHRPAWTPAPTPAPTAGSPAPEALPAGGKTAASGATHVPALWAAWCRSGRVPPTEHVERDPARVLGQLSVQLGAQRVGGREADHHVAHEVDAQGAGGVGLRGGTGRVTVRPQRRALAGTDGDGDGDGDAACVRACPAG